MAKFTTVGGAELSRKISRLANGSVQVAQAAVYAAAAPVADQARSNLRAVLSGNGTGDLEDSLGITSIKIDEDGVVNVKIGFEGYDRKGVPNMLKARALESGTSRGQPKRPFMRPAGNKSRAKASRAAKKAADAKIKELIEQE